MHCKETEKRLSAYADGETGPEESRRIQAHLLHCARCRLALDELKALDSLLNCLPDPGPDPRFGFRVRAGLARTGPVTRARWIDRVLLPAATAAILVLGLWIGNITVATRQDRTEPDAGNDVLRQLAEETLGGLPEGSLAEAYFELTQNPELEERP